jgi:hypothetical protein
MILKANVRLEEAIMLLHSRRSTTIMILKANVREGIAPIVIVIHFVRQAIAIVIVKPLYRQSTAALSMYP